MRAILLLALAAGGAAANAAEPPAAAGMIVDAGAGSFVERGGRRSPLALGDLVYAGDRLATGAAASSLLFCPKAERITLGANTLAEVTRDAVAVRKGPAAKAVKVRQCVLPRVALGMESLERIGGLRARGYPPIPLYLGGLVRSRRPPFEWAAIPGADSYRLTLRTAAGGEVWETEVRAARAEMPAATPELAPGAYEWEVLALGSGKTLARQIATFEIRPGPAADPDAADPLAAAAALENAEYYAEAAFHYRALRERNPGDARLTRRLAWLYWNSGLIAAADEEVKKLRK